MRARLLESEAMQDIEVFVEARRRIQVETIDDWTIRRTRTAKAIIEILVGDCIVTSRANLEAAGIRTAAEACANAENLIALSPESDRKLRDLEEFLLRRFYHHESLMRNSQKVQGWLGGLFERLCRRPEGMPGYFRRFIPQHGLERARLRLHRRHDRPLLPQVVRADLSRPRIGDGKETATMQKLITIYLDNTVYSKGKMIVGCFADKHGLIEEHLQDDLREGWTIKALHGFGGNSDGLNVRGWLAVLLEK